MKASLVLLAALLFAAALASGACGEDHRAGEDPNVAVTSTTARGLATCAAVRADLERLGTIGIPDSVDDAEAMITDELDQVEGLLHDVDDLSSRTTGPLQDRVRQATSGSPRTSSGRPRTACGTHRII